MACISSITVSFNDVPDYLFDVNFHIDSPSPYCTNTWSATGTNYTTTALHGKNGVRILFDKDLMTDTTSVWKIWSDDKPDMFYIIKLTTEYNSGDIDEYQGEIVTSYVLNIEKIVPLNTEGEEVENETITASTQPTFVWEIPSDCTKFNIYTKTLRCRYLEPINGEEPTLLYNGSFIDENGKVITRKTYVDNKPNGEVPLTYDVITSDFEGDGVGYITKASSTNKNGLKNDNVSFAAKKYELIEDKVTFNPDLIKDGDKETLNKKNDTRYPIYTFTVNDNFQHDESISNTLHLTVDDGTDYFSAFTITQVGLRKTTIFVVSDNSSKDINNIVFGENDNDEINVYVSNYNKDENDKPHDQQKSVDFNGYIEIDNTNYFKYVLNDAEDDKVKITFSPKSNNSSNTPRYSFVKINSVLDSQSKIIYLTQKAKDDTIDRKITLECNDCYAELSVFIGSIGKTETIILGDATSKKDYICVYNDKYSIKVNNVWYMYEGEKKIMSTENKFKMEVNYDSNNPTATTLSSPSSFNGAFYQEDNSKTKNLTFKISRG